MRASGIQLVGSGLTGASISTPVSIPMGFQGAILVSCGAGLDPAISQMNVSLKMGGVSGSGYVIAHSSKVITQNCLLGPLSLPAGEYVVRVIGGSTVANVYAALVPTP